MVKCLEQQNVKGILSINKDSVELDILDDGTDNKRVPIRLQYEVQVIASVEDN
jgi:hypothetical protein